MGIKSARVAATTMTLTAALLLAAGCNAGAAESEAQASLQRTLAQARPPYVTADAEGRKLWQLTKQFYERRQQHPAWIDGTNPHPTEVGSPASIRKSCLPQSTISIQFH